MADGDGAGGAGGTKWSMSGCAAEASEIGEDMRMGGEEGLVLEASAAVRADVPLVEVERRPLVWIATSCADVSLLEESVEFVEVLSDTVLPSLLGEGEGEGEETSCESLLKSGGGEANPALSMCLAMASTLLLVFLLPIVPFGVAGEAVAGEFAVGEVGVGDVVVVVEDCKAGEFVEVGEAGLVGIKLADGGADWASGGDEKT